MELDGFITRTDRSEILRQAAIRCRCGILGNGQMANSALSKLSSVLL